LGMEIIRHVTTASASPRAVPHALREQWLQPRPLGSSGVTYTRPAGEAHGPGWRTGRGDARDQFRAKKGDNKIN
jgi:hypothetical protein